MERRKQRSRSCAAAVSNIRVGPAPSREVDHPCSVLDPVCDRARNLSGQKSSRRTRQGRDIGRSVGLRTED